MGHKIRYKIIKYRKYGVREEYSMFSAPTDDEMQELKQIVPTLLYPTEVMDGAILSGNCVSACDKTTTSRHLSTPGGKAM